MIRKTLILMMSCAIVFSTQAQNIEFEEYKLDNGLSVILHQDNSTPIVTVSVLYHVGSKNEPEERDLLTSSSI